MKTRSYLLIFITLGMAFLLGLFLLSEPITIKNSQLKNHNLQKEIEIKEGSLSQGVLALSVNGETAYYSSRFSRVYKFNRDWHLSAVAEIKIAGIEEPHFGMLTSAQDGTIWGGVLDKASYPLRANSRLIQLDPVSLAVRKVIDISELTKYIDAFAFGSEGDLWFSYKDFVTVLDMSDLLKDKVTILKRYKILTGTAQAVAFRREELCFVGENNVLNARSLPQGLYCYALDKLIPYSSSLLNEALSFLDSVVSSINYKLMGLTGYSLGLLNRRLSDGYNYPSYYYQFGWPVGQPDNEGFSFDPISKDDIWISDAGGSVARRITLY